jgi:peptide/nickel transport system substrate-binding protein
MICLFFGCGRDTGREEESADRGGNLVASINVDPATFNRLFARTIANAMVAELLSSDLIHINRGSYEIEPALAESWESAADGRSYDLRLRSGLRFSDGSPCTVEDVVFTLNAIQDPLNASMMADQLRVDGEFPSVSQVDDNTIRIAWPRATGAGLRMLDSIPILPRNRLLQAHQEGTLPSAWGPAASPKDITGLGPFRLREYQRGTRVVLERNPYYWKKDGAGNSLPYLQTITFLVIPDRNAEALRFQSGEIDLLQTIDPENYISLRRSDNSRNYVLKDLGPGLRMEFLWFNQNPGKNQAGTPYVDPQKRNIFKQAVFRQAVSRALDRDGIVQSVYLGLATPQSGPISSGNRVWYNPDLPGATFDPKGAQALLAQAGCRDAGGDGTLECGPRRSPLEWILLTSRENASRERTAEIIRQNLAQVGIKVSVQMLPGNELIPRIFGTFAYEAVLFGFAPYDIIPDLQRDLWYSGGESHFWFPNQRTPATSWEAEIDGLISEMIRSLDPTARMRAFGKVQEIWARELPAIPIIAPNILAGWSNRVENIHPSVLSPNLLWNAEELAKR